MRDPSYYLEKQGRVTVLGPPGADECGTIHKRVDSVHKGWERKKMGEGLEGKREELLSSERG